MNSMYRIIILLFFVVCNINLTFSQVKPTPEKDEIALSIYIHGIKEKNDIIKVHSLLENRNWLKFIQVECYPQKHTEIIIKNFVTPQMLNEALKPFGFYIINNSFTDDSDIENSLFESRKMNDYVPFRQININK